MKYTAHCNWVQFHLLLQELRYSSLFNFHFESSGWFQPPYIYFPYLYMFIKHICRGHWNPQGIPNFQALTPGNSVRGHLIPGGTWFPVTPEPFLLSRWSSITRRLITRFPRKKERKGQWNNRSRVCLCSKIFFVKRNNKTRFGLKGFDCISKIASL